MAKSLLPVTLRPRYKLGKIRKGVKRARYVGLFQNHRFLVHLSHREYAYVSALVFHLPFPDRVLLKDK